VVNPLLLLSLALLAAPAARADVVVLKDGRKLEGKVLEEGATTVRLRLRFGGEETVARDLVERIERKPLPEEAVAEKRKALAPGDAAGLWKLALEAKGLGLRREYDALRAEVLRADADHREANEAEGNVEWEGRWVKPAERDRLRAEKESAAKAAAGLVEYGGRWVTPEERDALEKGLVLQDGKWMSEKEAKEAQGFVHYRDGWVRREELARRALQDSLSEAAGVPLTLEETPHFQVATVYAQAETKKLALAAEAGWSEFATVFGVKPEERLLDTLFAKTPQAEPGRCRVVVLEREPQYQKFLDAFLRLQPEAKKLLSPERIALMRRQKGFYMVDPDCWVVGYQFPNPQEQMRNNVVHKASHVLLMRWRYTGTRPGWWLLEGFAEFQEVNQFGKCDVYCITAGHGDPAGEAKWVGESWKAVAKRLAATRGDRGLKDLAFAALNDLTPYDLVKSWSVVHYLVALDREKFARLVHDLKKGVEPDAAFRGVYGAEMKEMDDRWREYVRRTY